jgi:hypothetical protein
MRKWIVLAGVILVASGASAWATRPAAKNLLQNPGFESGNGGFSSDYQDQPDLGMPGTYAIGADPGRYNGNWANSVLPHSGNAMMIVNGSDQPNVPMKPEIRRPPPIYNKSITFTSFMSQTNTIGPAEYIRQVHLSDGLYQQDQPYAKVWSEGPLTVQPNTTYYFTGYVASLYQASPPVLAFTINGVQLGAVLPLGPAVGQWIKFTVSWNSGASDSATLSIADQNTEAFGNDFAMDDLGFATSPLSVAQQQSAPQQPSVSQQQSFGPQQDVPQPQDFPQQQAPANGAGTPAAVWSGNFTIGTGLAIFGIGFFALGAGLAVLGIALFVLAGSRRPPDRG